MYVIVKNYTRVTECGGILFILILIITFIEHFKQTRKKKHLENLKVHESQYFERKRQQKNHFFAVIIISVGHSRDNKEKGVIL